MSKFARPTSYMGRQANKDKTGSGRFATNAEAVTGTANDLMISPLSMAGAVDDLIPDASTTVKGKIRIATVAEAAAGSLTTVAVNPLALAALTLAGSVNWGEGTRGIGPLATQAMTNTGTDDDSAITPLKLKTNLASPPAIGGTAPDSGAFTDLAATGVGTGNILVSDTASSMGVTGAGTDLTLDSSAGRVVINAEEAAANAVTILSAAGGLDVDVALQMNLASSQNAASAIVISASAGGIDMTAAGGAGEDIDISNTAGSVNITAGESGTDSIVVSSTIGGIQINAAGAAAGEDIALTATGSSIRLVSTESAGDAVYLESTAGGVQILASGAAAGEDIVITATGSSVNVTSTEDVASSIYLRANGGTSETIKIHSDLGTGVASLDLLSDVGGITLTSGLASADAINIVSSNAGGGIDIDSGTAGTILDSTGAISLDAAAASNFSVSGAGIDLDLASSAGRIIVTAGEDAADAIYLHADAGTSETIKIHSDQGTGVDSLNLLSDVGGVTISAGLASADAINIVSSNAGGGIDIDSGTAGTILDSTGAISLDAAAASNFSTSGAGIDLTLASASGRVIVDAGEDAADAIYLHADAGTSETIRLHSDQGTGAASVHLESDVGGVTLTSGLASADAINLSASAGGVDIDGALEVNIASSRAATGALTLSVSNAAANITHTGACAYTPDSVTGDNAGVAASINTVMTLLTTDGDSNLDNITLANGLVSGQIKHFAVVAVGNASDSIKITPASMFGGTQITFSADPSGLGCSFVWDGSNWVIYANNGGTIA